MLSGVRYCAVASTEKTAISIAFVAAILGCNIYEDAMKTYPISCNMTKSLPGLRPGQDSSYSNHSLRNPYLNSWRMSKSKASRRLLPIVLFLINLALCTAIPVPTKSKFVANSAIFGAKGGTSRGEPVTRKRNVTENVEHVLPTTNLEPSLAGLGRQYAVRPLKAQANSVPKGRRESAARIFSTKVAPSASIQALSAVLLARTESEKIPHPRTTSIAPDIAMSARLLVDVTSDPPPTSIVQDVTVPNEEAGKDSESDSNIGSTGSSDDGGGKNNDSGRMAVDNTSEDNGSTTGEPISSVAVVESPYPFTASGTTQPPTTQPPSTQPPTTQPPSTQPPTTQPPSTQPPSTQPPSTQPPSTQPPSTQPPSTQPPTTQPPSTQPPTTPPAPMMGTTIEVDTIPGPPPSVIETSISNQPPTKPEAPEVTVTATRAPEFTSTTSAVTTFSEKIYYYTLIDVDEIPSPPSPFTPPPPPPIVSVTRPPISPHRPPTNIPAPRPPRTPYVEATDEEEGSKTDDDDTSKPNPPNNAPAEAHPGPSPTMIAPNVNETIEKEEARRVGESESEGAGNSGGDVGKNDENHRAQGDSVSDNDASSTYFAPGISDSEEEQEAKPANDHSLGTAESGVDGDKKQSETSQTPIASSSSELGDESTPTMTDVTSPEAEKTRKPQSGSYIVTTDSSRDTDATNYENAQTGVDTPNESHGGGEPIAPGETASGDKGMDKPSKEGSLGGMGSSDSSEAGSYGDLQVGKIPDPQPKSSAPDSSRSKGEKRVQSESTSALESISSSADRNGTNTDDSRVEVDSTSTGGHGTATVAPDLITPEKETGTKPESGSVIGSAGSFDDEDANTDGISAVDEMPDPPSTTSNSGDGVQKSVLEAQDESSASSDASASDEEDVANEEEANEGIETSEDEPGEATEEPAVDDASVCVSEEWLVHRGYSRSQFVHTKPIEQRVLCPSDAFSALPCGTEHHAVALYGELMSYRQLCTRVRCAHSTARVNSLWAFHRDSARGIDVGLGSQAQLFMHDTRYPRIVQVYLHFVLRAARYVRTNAHVLSARPTFPTVEATGANAPVCLQP